MPTEDSITSDDKKERHRARARAHYHRHRERYKAKHAADKESKSLKIKAYRQANREKVRAKERAYREANKEKYLARKKAYREANRDLIRAKMRGNGRGLTPEAIGDMERSQDGRCWICRTPFSISGYQVDHCHATGKVRGLLCRQCNNGLGQFGDSPSVLRRAIKYLQAHTEVV